MQASGMIGLLIEDIRVEHHTEAAYCIEQELTHQNYTCITLSTGSDPVRKASCIRILEQRRVEGVILIGSMFGTPEVKDSICRYLPGVPIVMVNGFLDLPNVYAVTVDEERGVEQCVEFLSGRGRRHVAFVQDLETPANQKKLRGFQTAMLRLGIAAENQIVYRVEADTATGPVSALMRGRAATKQLLEEHPDTDAILYAVDLQAIGGMEVLQEKDIRIPEEIAVIGVDNTLYGRICTPRLTTLNNKLAEASKHASQVLLGALEGKEASHHIQLPTELIERETT